MYNKLELLISAQIRFFWFFGKNVRVRNFFFSIRVELIFLCPFFSEFNADSEYVYAFYFYTDSESAWAKVYSNVNIFTSYFILKRVAY